MFLPTNILADENGIWLYPEEIRGGTFGLDEQAETSSFEFINPVNFEEEVSLTSASFSNFSNCNLKVSLSGDVSCILDIEEPLRINDTLNGIVKIGFDNILESSNLIDNNNELIYNKISNSNSVFQIKSGVTTSHYSAIDFFDKESNKWGVGKDRNNNFFIDEFGVANRFFIQKGTGNIGIGSTNPIGRLDINTSETVELSFTGDEFASIKSFSSKPFYIRTHQEQNLNLGTNNQDVITITGNGNVGIGTDNPNPEVKLDVAGSIGVDQICNRNGSTCIAVEDIITTLGDFVENQVCTYKGVEYDNLEVFTDNLGPAGACECGGTRGTRYIQKQCNFGTVIDVGSEYITGRSCNTCFDASGVTCFTAGTQVLMEDGTYKNIEDVEIGERVVGNNGNINTVQEFHRPNLGERKLVSINGGPYFVTEDHPMLTREGWKSLNPEMSKKNYPRLFAELQITELKIGDSIVKVDGDEFIFTLKTKSDDPNTPLYSFMMDGDNTFNVYDYITHNCAG